MIPSDFETPPDRDEWNNESGSWRTRDGRDLEISDMTTDHIRNAILYCEKRYGVEECAKVRSYRELCAEHRMRLSRTADGA